MQPYSDWQPTGFDPKGMFSLDMEGREDWLVVGLIRTRDSEPLEESNFECAWSLISDATVLDSEVSADSLRFNHWGPGWFEIIVVRPGSHACKVAEEIEARLADYPVLDEEDLSEREMDAVTYAWESMSVRERARLIAEVAPRASIFAARRDTLPEDGFGAIFDALNRC